VERLQAAMDYLEQFNKQKAPPVQRGDAERISELVTCDGKLFIP